jgi:superfamily II DNA/RNA helicase
MLHGDVKQYERERIYNDFKRGRILKIVATSVLARGVDFPDVELVIQVEPPRNVEHYIHRAGRTGRAGKDGVSVLLFQKRTSDRVRIIEDEGKFKFKELFELGFEEKNAQKKEGSRYDERDNRYYDKRDYRNDRYDNRHENRYDNRRS